jgi:putative Mg2+ transporter-C (MgtC) family protein
MEGSTVNGIADLELVGRLLLAALLGLAIGFERERAGQPAGQRTHALVALGAATFAILSVAAFPGSDPARIAAGVVTGLGFLGTGIILRNPEHMEIRGLTTAAGIWTVGGIGIAIGAGMYVLGIATAALVGLILVLEHMVNIGEQPARRRHYEPDAGRRREEAGSDHVV